MGTAEKAVTLVIYVGTWAATLVTNRFSLPHLIFSLQQLREKTYFRLFSPLVRRTALSAFNTLRLSAYEIEITKRVV